MTKENAKLIFMGTPEISAKVFERMILDGYHFVALISQEDKKVGRKGIIEKTPTKLVAEKYNIPVFQPHRIRKEFEFVEELKPDLIITFAYGQIVPDEVLNAPTLGCINLHGSLLPKYRGAAPIQYSLINNEEVTGVTLMRMVSEMDAGAMYAKEEVKIEEDDNSTSLFEKISVAAGNLILRTLPFFLNGQLVSTPQDPKLVSFAPMIKPEQERIDITLPKEKIMGWIRGLSDQPGAYLILNGKKIKIFKAKIISDFVVGQLGEVINADKKGIFIQLSNGVISLLELQEEGRKRLDYKSFLNGNRELKGKIFE